MECDGWRDEKTPVHAAMRADEMLDVGDLDGHAVWKAILKTVIELVNKEPEGTVHHQRTMSASGYKQTYTVSFEDVCLPA